MIFSRSDRVKKEINTTESTQSVLPPQSSLSTKGVIKIVDNWIQSDVSNNPTPGPGAYYVKDSFNKSKGLKFSTKTVESKIKIDNSTPGPGAYAPDVCATTLIKKSFNRHNHVPLYKVNNSENNDNDDNDNKLKPTRIKGASIDDDDDGVNNNDTAKLRTRKEIKETMLSLRSLAIYGEIDD